MSLFRIGRRDKDDVTRKGYTLVEGPDGSMSIARRNDAAEMEATLRSRAPERRHPLSARPAFIAAAAVAGVALALRAAMPFETNTDEPSNNQHTELANVDEPEFAYPETAVRAAEMEAAWDGVNRGLDEAPWPDEGPEEGNTIDKNN